MKAQDIIIRNCVEYCGVACVDGSCPIANYDEYVERGYFLVRDCNECPYYKGCEDCAFFGTEICPSHNKSVC